jgi:ParB family chromosome partitioning protein
MAQLSKRFQQIAQGEHRRSFDIFPKDESSYLQVPIDQIQPDRNQPRKDLGDLDGLKASIAIHGIMQPLIVSPNDIDRYTLIAGERRYSCARALGLETVPAIVRTVEEHQRLELQLVENLHRKDLNPIEEAGSYKRLMDEFGLTQDEVGRRIGKSQTSISETLRLLDLPDQIKAELRTSDKTSKSLLLEIVKQPETVQHQLWEEAKRGSLTVKKARQQKSAGRTAEAGKARPAQKEFKTQQAVVTVRFRKARVTQAEIRQALEEALAILD